mgnify:CR=1 FL=1
MNTKLDRMFENDFVRVPRPFIRRFNLNTAMMLSEIYSEYRYWKDRDALQDGGWFFSTIENMYYNTGLSKHQQLCACKELQEYGIIKVKSGEEFDMILVDIMMSDFSGIDVLKALKTLEDYKIPPIIAFTANALSGMKEEYLSEGFDDYLEKPIVYKDLMRIFNKYF